MTLLEDAAAIHAALGLPEAVKGVLPVAQAAAELMGTPFAHGTPLPVVLSELKKMIDNAEIQRHEAAVQGEPRRDARTKAAAASRHRTIDQHERMAQARVEKLTSGGLDEPQERSGVGRRLPHREGDNRYAAIYALLLFRTV